MSKSISTVAIDGPAGSGKSTVGAALAARLGFLYFDTGVMYRAVALGALRAAIPTDDGAALTALAQRLHIEVFPPDIDDGRQYTVRLDGEDVTWALRTAEVEARVSAVARHAGVREEMVRQQRRIAAPGRIVMVGRDIGTVVLPDADAKIYLIASPEERARRRHAELIAQGDASTSYETVLADVRTRDARDSSRTVSPLRAADDAHTVDSTHIGVRETVEHILRIVRSVEETADAR
jgi:cytidylate kinase